MSPTGPEPAPARRGRGRPRGQDSSVVREGALRAAIELIAQQGYAATSMAQVAAAAGISPSGLAHHFSSKQALLGAVLDHRDRMDTLPEPTPQDPPWNRYDAMVDLARQNMRRTQLVQLYASMTGEAVTVDHPAHGWLQSHYDLVIETLRDGLVRDQGTGHVREDAPVERIARSFVALMDGLQLQWLLNPGFDMAEALAEHLEDLRRTWGRDPA